MLVLIARTLASWLPPQHRENEVCRFLSAATEPVLAPLRRLLPPFGGLDFSPLLVLLVLEVIRQAIGE